MDRWSTRCERVWAACLSNSVAATLVPPICLPVLCVCAWLCLCLLGFVLLIVLCLNWFVCVIVWLCGVCGVFGVVVCLVVWQVWCLVFDYVIVWLCGMFGVLFCLFCFHFKPLSSSCLILWIRISDSSPDRLNSSGYSLSGVGLASHWHWGFESKNWDLGAAGTNSASSRISEMDFSIRRIRFFPEEFRFDLSSTLTLARSFSLGVGFPQFGKHQMNLEKSIVWVSTTLHQALSLGPVNAVLSLQRGAWKPQEITKSLIHIGQVMTDDVYIGCDFLILKQLDEKLDRTFIIAISNDL